MTNFKKLFSITLYLSILLFLADCSGNSQAALIPLTAEAVDPTPAETCLINPADPSCTNTIHLNALFNATPGQRVKASGLGLVDPVGTTLLQDYDGDGLTNQQETINGTMFSNFWVADYPMIETSITAPVSMRIEMLTSTGVVDSNIISDITSTDLESRRNRGSEKFHQNQMRWRTQKVGKDTTQKTSAWNANVGITAKTKAADISAGGGYDASKVDTSIRDVFQTRKFKNNIKRKATSVKSNSAVTRARKYRNDKTQTATNQLKTNPDGGYVRAALYIQNHSVNMPVRLTNILCSLMFETAEGELLPVQSFRLRNADYSLFSIDVYGNSEFGPYVVELKGLNAAEIENAILKGYTPLIYLVDYEMTHVTDSNYKAALSSSFTGNNLKIIEENAKGRTSLLKLIGPNLREMFRVTAFQVDGEDPADACAAPAAPTWLQPGVSLKRALQRIACSGYNIQTDHYVFDFSGTEYEQTLGKFYVESIKSINGITNNVTCDSYLQGTLADGTTNVTACVIKPTSITEAQIWTEAQWTVFANGRYYYLDEPELDTLGNQLYFDAAQTIPLHKGVNSIIWAGDNYDITFLSMGDLLNREREFGTNPFETGADISLNTKWNKSELGINPDDPNVKSVYLGKAGLNDQIEIKVALQDTWTLNPSFGTPTGKFSYNEFKQFSYNLQKEIRYFNLDEAFDLEVSFGLGGTKDNWYNIARTVADPAGTPPVTDTNNATDNVQNCGHSWDYIGQVFTVCIQVPSTLAGVGPDGVVDVYIRPALNNAYRNTVWPKNYLEVNRFQGDLLTSPNSGQATIELINGTGELAIGTAENNTVAKIGSDSYTIASTEFHDRIFEITIQNAATPAFTAGVTVNVAGVTFNGTLKTTTTANELTFNVIPDTTTDTLTEGNFLAGQPITINGTGYAISTVRLIQNVHTINLQTALSKTYLAGEQFSIYGALTSQQSAVQIDYGFASLWNTDQANSHTVGRVPYDGNQLYTTTDYTNITCSYGVDIAYLNNALSPHCQGSKFNYYPTLWLGDGAFTNNWADSSTLNSSFTTPINPLVSTTTGASIKTLPVPYNNQLSTEKSLSTRSANWGDKTVIVWSEETFAPMSNIMLNVVDPATGTSVSGNITIYPSQLGDVNSPDIGVFNNTALIIWENIDKVWGQFFDLSTLTPSGAMFQINTSAVAVHRPLVNVTQAGKALVTWINDPGAGVTVRGRAYDMMLLAPDANPLIGSEFPIANAGTTIPFYDATSFGTSSVAIVNAGNSPNIWVTAFDLSTGNMTGQKQVNTTTTGTQANPRIAISNNTALITFRSDESAPIAKIRGVFYDLSTATLIGSDFLLHTNDGVSRQLPTIAYGTNYGIACWTHGVITASNIGCRIIDIHNQTLVNTSDFILNYRAPLNTPYTSISIKDDIAYIIWRSDISPGLFSYRMQAIDLASQAIITKSDILISDILADNTIYLIYPSTTAFGLTPNTIVNGNNVVLSWANSSGAYTQTILPGTVFPIKYGLNNYFTSPLVERNYTINTRLLIQ